jgi:hypothetical protein
MAISTGIGGGEKVVQFLHKLPRRKVKSVVCITVLNSLFLYK